MSTPPASPSVQATELNKVYAHGRVRVRALDNVSVTIDSGRWTAIMGPSGSGKSTLMQCLAGLDSPDSGRVIVGTKEITRMGDAARTRLRRTHIGFIFQSFNLVPVLSVKENILLPGKLAFRRARKDRFNALVDELGIANVLRRKPHELSGGQQQRVAIARALLPRPDVVFADEPTGNLDSESGEAVLGLLGNCAKEFNQTVVMVTHDSAAAAHTDRVLLLADGRIAGDIEAPTIDSVNATMRQIAGHRKSTIR